MLRLSLILCLFLAACEPVNRYFGLNDDWIGEEVLEEAIRYETGAKIDLTPSSPE